jgi:hypothetical protein
MLRMVELMTHKARQKVNVPIVEALSQEGKDTPEMQVSELYSKHPEIFATSPPAVNAGTTVVVSDEDGNLSAYLSHEALLDDKAYDHPFWNPTRQEINKIKVCDITARTIVIREDDDGLMGYAPDEPIPVEEWI